MNLFPTPNAVGLGLYGQIPVDFFTGIPNIDIPLYTFKSRDITVPIHLSYHAAGIRPSDHASWVGLGWSLQAGGVITRIQNDLPDELLDFTGGTGVGYPRGFFYNYTHLAVSGWTSSDSLSIAEGYYADEVSEPNTGYARTAIDNSPDEFQFNFLGMSGSMFMGQDGNWHLKSKQGLNFVVSTEIGPFAVWEPNFSTITGANYPSLIHNCLAKFILTAADGTQYSFGTDPATNMHGFTTQSSLGYFTSVDSNAVEFTRVGRGYSNTASTCRDGGTVPISWYLTKIKSPTGDSVTFHYTRDGYQIMDNTEAFGSFYQCNACNPYESLIYGAGDNISILDGSTLSTITGANGSVQFNKSKAEVLDWTTLGDGGAPQNAAWDNGGGNGLYVEYANEVFQGSDLSDSAKSTFMELDSMQINDINGNRLRSFNFTYASGSTQRLFLLSLLGKGSDGSSLVPYSFTYNNIQGLNEVPYNTLAVDHWGYYTNVYPFTNLFGSDPPPTTYNPFLKSGSPAYYTTNAPAASDSLLYSFGSSFNAQYVANRAPVPIAMQYGVLTQINYPTGGTAQFTWEPNSYSKYVQVGSNKISVSVVDMGSTIVGGGLRIRQITSQAGFNSPALTKTYLYERNYLQENTITSGVLNTGLPLYVDSIFSSGNFIYRSWSSNDVLPAYHTSGSPVTYSAVTELNADGSFKTYTYSNQDNGYLDIPPVAVYGPNYTNIGTLWNEINMSTFDLEQGLLLNESWYNSTDTLIKNIAYQYNDSSTRTNSAIHRYHYDRKFSLNGAVLSFDGGGFLTVATGTPLFYGDIVAPLNVYIEYPYLASTTETDYDQQGSNPLVKTTNYTYDSYRNKNTESFTSSEGQLVSTTYNYAANTISGLSTAAQQGQAAMVSAGMFGIPLETIQTRSGNQTSHKRIDYKTDTNTNTFIVPANSFQSSYGQPMDSATRYINYDSKGNVSEFMTRNGLVTCLDWGYYQTYPTVKVLNAYNTLRTYYVTTTPTVTSSLFWTANDFANQTVTFNVTYPGTITLAGGFGENPGSDVYNFGYTLTGPVNESGSLCICGSGGNCGATPASVPFNNMPIGTYTLTVGTSSSYSIGTDLAYTYPTIVYTPTSTGAKNYFYDGFEENTNVSVISGTAHTGNFYWGASTYTTSFVPPDNNTYTIEWWNLQSGSWTYNTQTYSQGMSLIGPVDDVRIFPSTAQMSTYTYQPLVGMTSAIDPKGYTSYYTYDAMGRLATVLDKDKNVLKRYCYNYAGQAQSCQLNATPSLVSVNGINSTTETFAITFTNQANNATYNLSLPPGNSLIGEVPAGTYGVLMAPNTYNASDPNLYELYSYSQTYYATVGYGGVNVSGNCPINISPAPNVPVQATNTTTETFTITFTNNANNATYTFTLPPGTSTIGSVPPGTYGVLMAPNTYSSSDPNLYEIYTYTQTYYATVGYGNLNVSGSSCPINISPAN